MGRVFFCMKNDDQILDEGDPNFVSEDKLRKLRNLKMFHYKETGERWPDDEILAYIANRPPKGPDKPEVPKTDEEKHESRFNYKLRSLKAEYAVDMNESNDAESLKALVRMSLQNEEMDKKIQIAMKSDFDPRDLKNLFDAQRAVTMSISDLQEKLGISRRQRKAKEVDDIPKWVADVRARAKEFWQGNTVPVTCPKCQIELARFWINFPKIDNKLSFTTKCWKCEESVVFNR